MRGHDLTSILPFAPPGARPRRYAAAPEPATHGRWPVAQQPTWRGHRAPVEDAGSAALAASAGRARWPLVLGIVLALAVIAGCAALTGRMVHRDQPTLPAIAVGTCLRSPDLATGSASLRKLDAVACHVTHDAEVFALRTVQGGEDLDAVGGRCLGAAEDRGIGAADLLDRGLEVRPLALTDTTPDVGDTVACFVRHSNGTPLRGAVFSTGSD